MVDATEGVLGIEWIEGKTVRMLLGGGAEGEEEKILDFEEPPDETTDTSAESVSHIDTLEEYQVTIGGFLIPNSLSPPSNLSRTGEIMELIGSEIARMHKADIIHGDLTTSNMIIRHPFATKGPSPTKLVCGLFTNRCSPRSTEC